MKRLVIVMSFLACVSSQAADPRIRTERYDPNTVYDVLTKSGRATLIQLEEGETLKSPDSTALGMGDSAAWSLGVRGNNIVFKPKDKMPDTNLVLVTNKRTYSFDFKSVGKGVMPTYVLRFTYPDTEAARALAEATAEAKRLRITAASKAEPIAVNTNYVWRGEFDALKPTAAYDDGRFTRLVYDHSGELPVFYKVLPDGTEALINSNIDPEQRNTVVLHEVIRTVRARLGNAVIEIANRSYKLPGFNKYGTSVPGAVRVEKGEQYE